MKASRCLRLAFFVCASIALVSTTEATTYYSDTGASRTWTISVNPGTHTFIVNGITSYRETDWYVNGSYIRTDISEFLNGYWDPTYDYPFSSGTVAIVARVYNSSNTLLETHTWNVTVVLPTYTVSASAGTGGTVTPSSRTVTQGNTTTFTVTPSTGYSRGSVSGDAAGGSWSGNTYTTAPVRQNRNLTFSFVLNTYTVSAAAGTGGTVTPSSRTVSHGSTTTFTVSPSTGYTRGSVSGDAAGGSWSGNTYTTAPVTQARTLTFSFVLNTYTVSAAAGTGGTVSPSSRSVSHGSTTTFTVSPSTGYTRGSVSGDAAGGSWSGNTYTTAPVTQARNLTFSFTPHPDLHVTSIEINDNTAADQQFTPGQSVKLDFLGYNAGPGSSLSSIRMKWWYGTSANAKTTEIASGYLGTINGLSAGESEWETDASWNVPTTPGTYWLTAMIDDDNQQTDETYENNNERTLRFIVNPPPFAPYFRDARIANRVDSGDGYARQLDIEFDVDSNAAGNFYVKVYEYDGGALLDDYLTTSSTFAVSGVAVDYRSIRIVCDSYPGIDQLSHGTAEFKLELYNAANNALVQTWTPSQDADLGSVLVELSSEDPLPTLTRSPASLAQTITQGQTAGSQSFDVWNSGEAIVTYTISDDATWLSVNPASGSSTGEYDAIAVNYATSGLAAGSYNATITITAAAASGSPQTIPVTLTVVAPDLIAYGVSVSDTTVDPGQTITVNWTAKNQGDGGAGATQQGVMWSTDSTISRTDTLLEREYLGPMDANVTSPEAHSITIPANATPGQTYYIGVYADYDLAVDESNENNNSTTAVAVTINGRILSASWWMPLDVANGDVVTMCAEVTGIPLGTQCIFQVFEDDGILQPDDPILPTLTGTVYQGEEGRTYVKTTWVARWLDDQFWTDPEYYFKVAYGDASLKSSRNADEEVVVRNIRQQPCTAEGDFYYDPGTAVGEATKKATLMDDRIPIILIHGKSGDTKVDSLNYWYAWANADTSETGSQLGRFNDVDMKNSFRVYRYVYDSRGSIADNGAAFASFVNQFCQNNLAFSERQVVVMAHSMGGLVARYALNTDSAFRDRVHRLITLGTPHLGSPGANPTWLLWAYPGTLGPSMAILNETLMHDNTQGYFDLAWHNVSEIPLAARSKPALLLYHPLYNDTWLSNSLTTPFCNGPNMVREDGDAKITAFAGYTTWPITDGTGSSWPDYVAEEVVDYCVLTDHRKLFAASGILGGMVKENGTLVGLNDGLVPLPSALLGSGHSAAEKINLTQSEGEPLDHSSYLDVGHTMDYVADRLNTMIKVTISPQAAVDAGARWRISGGAWQKSIVSLNALAPGQYTIEFKDVPGWTKPANQTLKVAQAATTNLTGSGATYTLVPNAPTITTTCPLPAGTVGASYNQTLAATGGVTPYTWTISGGALPSGLSVNSGTGVVSGTPSTTGTSNFTIRCTGSNSHYSEKACSATINPDVPTLAYYPAGLANSIPQGQNATSQTFEVWNSGGGPMSYSITDDASWLSAGPTGGTSAGEHDAIQVNYSTASLVAGTYTATITITASGANNSPQIISVALTVNSLLTRTIGLAGSLAFGDVVTNTMATRTLTIANSGNSVLTVSNIGYPPLFSGAWSGTIPANASTNVTVAFTPTAVQTYGGPITVVSDATSGLNTINASGTGVPRNCDLLVTSSNDSGPGSLRQAILNANGCGGGAIEFSNVTGTITLTSGELLVNGNVKILGPGPSTLAVSGNGTRRVFNLNSNLTVFISGLTIRDGRTSDGTNGVDDAGSPSPGGNSEPGGGIYSAGTLTLSNCVVSGNRTGNGGHAGTTPNSAGGSPGSGGGVYSIGALTLCNCSLSNNAAGAGGSGFGLGSADGGAGGGIYSAGVLTLTNCVLVGNSAGQGGEGVSEWHSGGGQGGAGGAIYAAGPLTVKNCIFSGNSSGGGGYCGGYSEEPNAGNGGNGGAIYSTGSLVLDGSTLVGNSTGRNGGSYSGNGGNGGAGGAICAIYGGGPLTMSSCTLSNNSTADGGSGQSGNGGPGGGIYSAGELRVDNCTISGNSTGRGGSDPYMYYGGDGGDGGGVCHSGTLTMSNCMVNGNTAGDSGGGDMSPFSRGGRGGGINAGAVSLSGCTVSGNRSGGALGGLSGGGPGGDGGGICSSGLLTARDCTFSGNIAGNGGDGYLGTGGPGGSGAGVYSASSSWMTNCTLVGNTAGNGGSGGFGAVGGDGGNGAGIYAGSVTLINCTISRNTNGSGGTGDTDGKAGAGGGVCSGGGGQVLNTIVALNLNSRLLPDDVFGAFTSLGHNLVGDTNGSSGFGATGDVLNVDPELGLLAHNGGPTFTCALLPGSPALDAGTAAGAPITDQRGVPRPQGLGVDIGAFEFQPNVLMFTGMSFQFHTNFCLQSCGVPGGLYTLQASTNLVNWLNVMTASVGSNGVWECIDTNASRYPARFYRILQGMPAD